MLTHCLQRAFSPPPTGAAASSFSALAPIRFVPAGATSDAMEVDTPTAAAAAAVSGASAATSNAAMTAGQPVAAPSDQLSQVPAAAAPTAAAAAGAASTEPEGKRQRGAEYYKTTVFVGGLNEQVSEADLEQLFAYCGQVVHVRIVPGKLCVWLNNLFGSQSFHALPVALCTPLSPFCMVFSIISCLQHLSSLFSQLILCAHTGLALCGLRVPTVSRWPLKSCMAAPSTAPSCGAPDL